MMYVYSIGSIFTFLCMIISVLFGQLMNGEQLSTEQLISEAISEEQEQEEEIDETLDD